MAVTPFELNGQFTLEEFNSRIGEINDGYFDKEQTLTPEVASLYGLGADAVPDDVLAKSAKLHSDSLIRDLNIMLNLSLGTNNIDAWADILNDANQINTTSSNGYILSGGAISKGGLYQTAAVTNSTSVGKTGQSEAGQTFLTLSNKFFSAEVKLSKQGSPSDGVKMYIYSVSGGVPNTQLYESTNTIAASQMSTSANSFVFQFSGVNLTSGATYAFVLKRTGALNDSNCYMAHISSNVYTDGTSLYKSGGTWGQDNTMDLYFKIECFEEALVVWKAKTATEAFVNMAISAVSTLGTGTITFFVSDDGVNWTEITALNAAQTVNFDATSVYLKAVITKNASLSSVAWGGY